MDPISKNKGIERRLFQRSDNRWRIVAVVCCLFFMGFALANLSTSAPWRTSDSGTDTFVFQYVAMEMDAGNIPYKDTFDHKGPLLYIINYFGYKICPFHGIWLFEVVAVYITLVFAYLIPKRILGCGSTSSLLVVIICAGYWAANYQGGNLTEQYAAPCIAFALYVFLDFLVRGRTGKPQLFLCGFGMGAVLLLRANMAATWVVLGAAAVVCLIRERRAKELARYVLWFMAGALVIMVPVFIWLLANHAFSEFLFDYIAFNSQYSHDQERAGLYQKAHSVGTFLNNSAMLCGLGILVYEALADRRRRWLNSLYIVLVAIAILLTGMSGQTYPHYAIAFVPMLSYAFGLLFAKKKDADPQAKSARRYTAFAISLFLTVAYIAPTCINALDGIAKDYWEESSTLYSKTTADVVLIINENTSPDEEISVFGNWDAVYLFSDRFSATKYSYQFPPINVSKEIEADYFRQLKKAKPKAIVLAKDKTDNKLMNAFLDDNSYKRVFSSDDGAQVYIRPS